MLTFDFTDILFFFFVIIQFINYYHSVNFKLWKFAIVALRLVNLLIIFSMYN
jgi:hypothetical protein